MNIGDRVRAKHSIEEGIVVSIVDHQTIEIEIEEGFTIPFLKKDVVIVESSSQFEERYHEDIDAPVSDIFSSIGLYTAICQPNTDQFESYLINNTDYILLLSFIAKVGTEEIKEVATQVKPKNYIILEKELSLQTLSEREYIFRIIRHTPEDNNITPPIYKTQRFKGQQVLKNKTETPLIGKKGTLFPIDQDTTVINPLEIKEQMESNSIVEESFQKEAPQKNEIDLHIEELSQQSETLTNEQMLQIQMNAFEKALDNALVQSKDGITFIHGIGNGVLRNKIHKYLSQHPHIKYFQDADKQKFGYGATFVKLK